MHLADSFVSLLKAGEAPIYSPAEARFAGACDSIQRRAA